MLVSLVHAGGNHEAAKDIFLQADFDASDEILRQRLAWVQAVSKPGSGRVADTPFTWEQLPEVIGTLMGMSDINRFSHVVMENSPVEAPFGLRTLNALALRMFGRELKVTRGLPLVPGRTLGLLPAAPLPSDMQWAKGNPRVANALSRYAAAVEREGAKAISPQARNSIVHSLSRWKGEQMPLDIRWVDRDVEGLNGEDEAIARLGIVLAKASYRVTEKMILNVLGEGRDEERFIRILAWLSFASARRFAQIVAEKVEDTDIQGCQLIAA
jgi:hypothetical protein